MTTIKYNCIKCSRIFEVDKSLLIPSPLPHPGCGGPAYPVSTAHDSPGFEPDPKIGPGGAPTRETTTPEDAKERKRYPVASGVIDYFPDALVALSRVSWSGNEQHNPGKPLFWDRAKSGDESDALMRHFVRRGTIDKDGIRHSAKVAWRALALLQKEIESECQ